MLTSFLSAGGGASSASGGCPAASGTSRGSGPNEARQRLAEDRACVARVLAGEVDAFAELVERYTPLVASICARHLPRHPAHVVEEAAQESFVRAFTSLASYSAAKPFPNWLTTIATRTCYGYLREKYARTVHAVTEMAPVAADGTAMGGQDWLDAASLEIAQERNAAETAAREAGELLDWAMGQLPPKERMVLTLTYLEELPAAEAAEALGMTTVNIRVIAHRARKKLHKLLDGLV